MLAPEGAFLPEHRPQEGASNDHQLRGLQERNVILPIVLESLGPVRVACRAVPTFSSWPLSQVSLGCFTSVSVFIFPRPPLFVLPPLPPARTLASGVRSHLGTQDDLIIRWLTSSVKDPDLVSCGRGRHVDTAGSLSCKDLSGQTGPKILDLGC